MHQAGSLVAPDRLRFDFTHHGPVKPERLEEIERIVNDEIWRAVPVTYREMPYAEARAAGAMALFGEKYGDVVRVVSVPGFSMELCGGTHVKNTAEIGLFRILTETGVASGVRRIEAATGPGAFTLMRDRERALTRVGELLKTPEDGVERRVAALLEERRALERRIEEAMRGGGDQMKQWLSEAERSEIHCASNWRRASASWAASSPMARRRCWWSSRTISAIEASARTPSCARSRRQPVDVAEESPTWRRPGCPIRRSWTPPSAARSLSYVLTSPASEC